MSSSEPTTFTSEAHTYDVVRALGQGGQGRTFLVERQGEPGSRYVLKLLRMEHVEDWKQVELFEREVTTLAALDHPGIPRLVDRIVEDDRTAGIVQSLVPGHTIAAQIAEHGPLSAGRFETIVRQTLEILAYLHAQVPPVMHRDINPRNVMLGPQRVFLIDFGAARVGGKTDMTSVGTFGYMAPEQIIGRPKPASDMYSLGMTLISLAERRDVGDLPHDDATGRVDTQRLLTSTPARVRQVLLDMIEPGLAERLTDPKQALARLDAREVPAVKDAPGPFVVAPVAPLAPLAPQASPRLLVPIIGGVMALLVAVAVTTILTVGRSSESDVVERTVVAPPLPAPPPVDTPTNEPALAPPREPPRRLAPPLQATPVELDDDNSAVLRLTSTPPADAYVDGRKACETPCDVRVPFGKHKVFMAAGGRTVAREVQVLEDTALDVSLVE